jgi:hypothetical protein
MTALELAVQGLKPNGNHLSSSWCRSHIASLIPHSNSLLWSKKFPVLARREFRWIPQVFCRVLAAKTAQSTPSQRYFPVFSLHIRETVAGGSSGKGRDRLPFPPVAWPRAGRNWFESILDSN